MDIFYVYILFYLDGIPCYVGKGKGDRWLEHEKRDCFRNNFLKGIVFDAKSRGLDLPKVKVQENLSEEAAFELERLLIRAIGRRNLGLGPLVNLTDGGDGETGRIVSVETRKKLALIRLGKRLDDKQKQKISEGVRRRGYIITEEHKKAASEKQKGRSKNWTEEGLERFIAAHKGKRWHLGHKHSEETKSKIREARLKQAPLSAEARAKLSLISAGRRHSPETIAKIKAAWVIRKEKAMRNVNDEVMS